MNTAAPYTAAAYLDEALAALQQLLPHCQAYQPPSIGMANARERAQQVLLQAPFQLLAAQQGTGTGTGGSHQQLPADEPQIDDWHGQITPRSAP